MILKCFAVLMYDIASAHRHPISPENFVIVILTLVTAANDVVLVIMGSTYRALTISPVRKGCGAVVHINHVGDRVVRSVPGVFILTATHPGKPDNQQYDDEDAENKRQGQLDNTLNQSENNHTTKIMPN